MLIVIPEFKERAFFDLHAAIPGEFIAIPHDADAFLESEQATGFRIWNFWPGVYLLKDLKDAALSGDWIPRMLAGVEGELWCLEAPEEPEEPDSTPDEEANVMLIVRDRRRSQVFTIVSRFRLVVPARGYKRESRFIAMHLFTTFLWNKSFYNSSHLSKNC